MTDKQLKEIIREWARNRTEKEIVLFLVFNIQSLTFIGDLDIIKEIDSIKRKVL